MHPLLQGGLTGLRSVGVPGFDSWACPRLPCQLGPKEWPFIEARLFRSLLGGRGSQGRWVDVLEESQNSKENWTLARLRRAPQ